MRSYRSIYIAAAIMLALYLFPWLVNRSASLSPNAYDLAEWASLHPAVRAETPMLLTSLLLRLPLACLALLIAFTTRRGWISILIVLVIAGGLLPPPEFLKATDDPNYRQQAGLALATLIGGGIGLSGLLPRQRAWIGCGIALIGAAASIIGLVQGENLMLGFNLPTQIGLGGIALAVAFVGVAGVLVLDEIRRQRDYRSRRMVAAVNQTGQR